MKPIITILALAALVLSLQARPKKSTPTFPPAEPPEMRLFIKEDGGWQVRWFQDPPSQWAAQTSFDLINWFNAPLFIDLHTGERYTEISGVDLWFVRLYQVQ